MESSPPPEASNTPFGTSDAPLEISADEPLEGSDVEFEDN